ncbi:MAG: DJ-1/PfpI family protein [Candidatus Aenigmatarchaeota archaeon]
MKILVPLAEGFEEIEAFAIIDILRRAGIKVDTVGVVGTVIKSARGISVMADKRLDEINPEDYDGIVLPGGNPGYINLGKSQKIIEIIKNFDEKNKLIAAICASPSILAKAGVLEDKEATIYPGMEKELPHPREGRVVVDKNVITSQAPGTAIEFALKIVEKLLGKEKAMQLKRDLVV